MGNLTIKSQSLATQAEFVDATSGLTINVNYNQDNQTGDLKSINGTVYKTENMAYAGNFNGQPNGGEMEYSIRDMKSKDMSKVFDAIEEIEDQITNQNEEGE